MKAMIARVWLRVAVLSVVGGLVMALSSRGENGDADTAPREWGQVSGGFQLSASLDKEWVGFCEPVVLHLTIKNVSGEALRLWETFPDHDFVLEVTDDRGTSAPLTRFGEIARHAASFRRLLRTVDPGEECSYAILVNRVHDMTLPGIYSIMAKYVEMGPWRERFEVVSNTVKIKIPHARVRPRQE